MTTTPPPPRRPAEPGRYAIRVRGHLADRWSQQFDGFTLARQDDGTTVLTGPVTDQAALHGLLHRVRDLGVPLLSVTPVPNSSAVETTDPTTATTTTGSSS